MTIIKKQEALSFDGLGIAPRLLNILTGLGFTIPTPIQLQSIPVSLKRKDMVGIAQTGTGKTLAFGVPMIQLLATHKGMGLVVLPTRELALQVEENLKTIGEKINLRTAVIIGGESMGKQLKALKLKPHIIIATPGRLIDHTERHTISLNNVKILVLDEADMMLDMGFLPQIKSILKQVPKDRQTMLFSATMPSQIINIAQEYMSLPTRIEVAPSGTSAKNVEQEMFVMNKDNRITYLKKILKESIGPVLIFARTKRIVKALTAKIIQCGFTATEIHSNRSLGQRQKALGGFKSGEYRIMVATDIAARGIDVKEIELVINYDLPVKSADYVHRIGRTGRAGKNGKAISFVLPTQLKDVKDIERLISRVIKTSKIATDPNVPRDTINVDDRRGGTGKNYVKNRGVARKSFRSSGNSKGVSTPRSKFYTNTSPNKMMNQPSKFKSTINNNKKSANTSFTKTKATKNKNNSNKFVNISLTDRQKFVKSMSRGRFR